MSATFTTMVSPAGESRRRLYLEVGCRFALCALAVGICYLFKWYWLCTLTAECNLLLSRAIGIDMVRYSPDIVRWHTSLYQYVVACTFADVWCGALPLLWNLKKSVAKNLELIAVFTVGLFVFNIVRLSISDVLVAGGLSRDLGHNVLSGVAYFAIWLWIMRHRPWRQEPLAAAPPASEPSH